MSAQDLEQRAQFEEWVRKRHGLSVEVWDDSGKYKYGNTHHFWECWKVAAALRQQPAPVIDNAGKVECAEPVAWITPESIRHLAKMNGPANVVVWNCASSNARVPLYTSPHQPAPVVPTLPGNWPEDAGHENGGYECLCSQCGATFYGHKRRVVCRVCAKPAPVVDDARMARALEWVRAECGFYNNAEARTHLPAIEEAIAAYDPNCGARTVRAQGVKS